MKRGLSLTFDAYGVTLSGRPSPTSSPAPGSSSLTLKTGKLSGSLAAKPPAVSLIPPPPVWARPTVPTNDSEILSGTVPNAPNSRNPTPGQPKLQPSGSGLTYGTTFGTNRWNRVPEKAGLVRGANDFPTAGEVVEGEKILPSIP